MGRRDNWVIALLAAGNMGEGSSRESTAMTCTRSKLFGEKGKRGTLLRRQAMQEKGEINIKILVATSKLFHDGKLADNKGSKQATLIA